MSGKARLHADGLLRCPWPGEDPFYMAYHDTEWGVPEYDDRALYEKLILDGFQAGLSWITILRKRDNFRRAFDDFEPAKIARYNAKKVHALMNDAGIVRNRAKIEGTVNSAKSYLKIMEEGPGFSKFLWDFVDGKPKVNNFKTTASVPAAHAAVHQDVEGTGRARIQVRRPDHRLCLHAGDRHGQRSSGDVPLPRYLRGQEARTPPQSEMMAKARFSSDVSTRAWQRMLSGRRLDLLDPSPLDIEIADIAHGLARVARWNGQTNGAHIFSVAQHTLLVEAVMREHTPRVDVSVRLAALAARRTGIRHRRHDLAVQGGARRRLQGGGKAAVVRDPHPLRIAAGIGCRGDATDQGRRQGGCVSRSDAARGLCGSRGEAPVRQRSPACPRRPCRII